MTIDGGRCFGFVDFALPALLLMLGSIAAAHAYLFWRYFEVRMSKRGACQLFLALALLFPGGCAVFGSSKDRAIQKDPNFRAGYEDGCAAATNHGSDLRDRPVGDKQLYANNETYRAGWASGFQTCRRSDLDPNAMPGDNPVRLPGPGH